MVRAAKSVLPVVALAAALGFIADLALATPDGLGPGATGNDAGALSAMPEGEPAGALSRHVSRRAGQDRPARNGRREPGRRASDRTEPGRRDPGPDEEDGRDPGRAERNRGIAKRMLEQRDWASPAEFRCLDRLWSQESGWDHRAEQPSTGAYGIPQAHPGTKMAEAGRDWRSNPRTQIKWGLRYVRDRHGGACEAWNHLRTHGWY